MGHPSGSGFSCLLPEGNGGAGGVDEDGEDAFVGDGDGIAEDGGAEGLGFVGCGTKVVDADVGEPGGGSLLHGHHAASGAGVGLEEAVGSVGAHVEVVEGPAEEFAVEVLCLGEIGGVEFEVNEGLLGHQWRLLSQRVSKSAHWRLVVQPWYS